MSLPWVRLDTGIASHDKILALLSDPSSKRWQAAFSFTCAIGWSGDHGTDGLISTAALPFVHGTPATARLLEKYRLWLPAEGGWSMPNYAERQELAVVTAMKKATKKAAAAKGNCVRWHGPECGCWRQEDAS